MKFARRQPKTFLIPDFDDLSNNPQMVEVDEDEIVRVLAYRIHVLQQQVEASRSVAS